MTESATHADGASRLGQLVSGRYRIEQLLGEGGMGAVYLAEHTLMRKRVALKLLHPDMSENEEVLARFRREAEAAAHIEHPNVAAATDFGQTEDGAFFLVLEYVEGTSLRHVLFGGAIAPMRALHVARQIALALERAHDAGIVHRDLKPENVMLVKKGDDADFVKVLDFGIAKIDASAQRAPSSQPLTRLGTILGTPEYMAPEQALGEVVGPAADLYAVGVMLYEMLTGKHPFDATDSMAVLSMHMIAPVPPMAERAPELPVDPAIESLVRRLLEKEASKRPQTARALIDAIDALAPAVGLSPAPPAPASRPDSIDAFAKTSLGTPAAPHPPPPGLARATTAVVGSSPLERVSERAKELVARLPRGALVAAAVAGPVIVLSIVLVLVLSLRSGEREAGGASTSGSSILGGSAGGTEPAKPKVAGEAKIAAAAKDGPDALEALAKSFPDDPQILRQLALTLNEGGRIAESLRAVRSMLDLGAAGLAAADPEIVGVVVGATGVSQTSDEAFALLEGPLGARGVDALIELAHVKSSRTLQRRAARSLAKPAVRANASPAAAVLLDMKAAKTCAAKKDLLERAKTEGDGRLLAVLRAMKEPRGCGFMGMRDCYPCLRKDSALDDAMSAIDARASN